MILVMKTNSIYQKICIGMFMHINIEVHEKNQTFTEKIHLLSSTWTLFFKLSQILGPIQVLVNSVKKHDYNNLAFEVHVNTS
jgi:hypothetical protein